MRGEGGRFRLDDVAEFLHGAQERLRGRATSRTRLSTSRSSRFQRSLGSTQLPILGREVSRLLAISILIASRTAERLTSKVSRPFRLVRQDGAGRIVAAHDPQADLAGQRGMHAGSGNARGVGPATPCRRSAAARRLGADGFLSSVRHASSNPSSLSRPTPDLRRWVRCDHVTMKLPTMQLARWSLSSRVSRLDRRLRAASRPKGTGRAVDERAPNCSYFWMQVSTVSLVHSSRPVNTGSATALPSIRSIMTDGAL